MDYESGAAVSLAMSLVSFVWGWLTRASVFHQNMAEIGYRKSWVSNTFKRDGSAFWEIPVALLFMAATVAMSWLGVLLEVCVRVYRLARDSGKPLRVKEMGWRLRNVPMSAVDMFWAMAEMAAAMRGGRELTPLELEAMRDEINEHLPELRRLRLEFATDTAALRALGIG